MLILFIGCSAFADDPQEGAYVDHLQVKRLGKNIAVDFSLKNVVVDKLTQTLDSGLPVRFLFQVRLVRKAGVLTSGVLADKQFERVLEKDNLKNRYKISYDGNTEEIPAFSDAIEALSQVEDFELAPVLDLIPDKRYQVEVQVKLEEFRLPFLLHRILPFMNLWDMTTPWKTQRIDLEGLGK